MTTKKAKIKPRRKRRVKLEWCSPRYGENEVAKHKSWTSRCGKYRVIRSRIKGPSGWIWSEKLEDGKLVRSRRRRNYPDVFYCQAKADSGQWSKIGEKYTENAAKKFCENIATSLA